MKIKVSASYSGKLPVASYSNVSPGFYAEIERELPDDIDGDEEGYIEDLQKDLHAICLRNFQVVADQAKIDKLKADMGGFRFYKTPNGEYPSVTTVLDPEFKSFVSDEELKVAIAEGNINHARAAHFIATGEWVEPKKLDGVAPDLLVCRGRIVDGWDFPAFLEKYPIKEMRNGVPVYNHVHRYAGTPDLFGLFPKGGAKDGELVKTIFDFKRTADKIKNFSQMSGYAKCEGVEVEQMAIIPTSADNQQGFSKPIVTTEIEKYFELFLDKREKFKGTYGV